tara:strand:+ start:624 stop:842 length:219 start_codon:yes stop_codon:yes gene_type:complete
VIVHIQISSLENSNSIVEYVVKRLKMSDWGSGNYPIESCPKCKKKAGYTWTWGKNDGHSKGYSTCKGCKAKF